MSLISPVSSKQFHSKPMAISTITLSVNSQKYTKNEIYCSNLESSNTCQSPSPQPTKSDIDTPNRILDSRATSLSPASHSSSNYSSWSTSSSPNSLYPIKNLSKLTPINKTQSDITQASTLRQSPYGSYGHRKKMPMSYHIDSISSDDMLSNMPLSLQERRLRNKTASAKYRAKRNQQHSEMRALIDSLTKENELLLRQLENVQFENVHLKDTCDKLRGKLMAQQIIKQYLNENKYQQSLDDGVTHCFSYELSTNPVLKNNQSNKKQKNGK